jgi:hypothetical protein
MLRALLAAAVDRILRTLQHRASSGGSRRNGHSETPLKE